MTRGRPRKIDPELVLEQAMFVFWERGFEATSMNDISAETGMAKPGLYANFGDKETLYCKALNFYQDKYGTSLAKELNKPNMSLRQSLESFLKSTVDFILAENHPVGCFVVNNNMECQRGAKAITTLSQKFDENLRQTFEDRIDKAKSEKELPCDVNAQILIDYYIGQLTALAVLAKKGYTKQQLYNVIDLSLQILPNDKVG